MVDTTDQVEVVEAAAAVDPPSPSPPPPPDYEVLNGQNATDDDDCRQGTVSSARFNILSTMVGGGALSLPMAFEKSGNALLGPLILIGMATITEFCFRIHVQSARILEAPPRRRRGKQSFESVASAAFGNVMHVFGMVLVTAMCFFGAVGYAVLLRDMLQPITDAIWRHSSKPGPHFHNNLSMATVAVLTTPLCTLQTLTALQKYGAASMCSILILGACILFRSVECNFGLLEEHHDWPAFSLFPNSWKDVLDVFPLYVSCYVCHYNLVPVHNELQQPTRPRVKWWLQSTVWSATLFYFVIGLSGSAYRHCTATGHVQGNVLLDFDETDPLLFLGRMCLAMTITLAFPMLTIPGRDILLRSLSCCWRKNRSTHADEEQPEAHGAAAVEESAAALREPLLQNGENPPQDDALPPSFLARLVAAILFFWSAVFVASCVESIDVVWDLLGSSLSILLSFLIPCGAFVVIAKQQQQAANLQAPPTVLTPDGGDDADPPPTKWPIYFASALVVLSVPAMIISTANAVRG